MIIDRQADILAVDSKLLCTSCFALHQRGLLEFPMKTNTERSQLLSAIFQIHLRALLHHRYHPVHYRISPGGFPSRQRRLSRVAHNAPRHSFAEHLKVHVCRDCLILHLQAQRRPKQPHARFSDTINRPPQLPRRGPRGRESRRKTPLGWRRWRRFVRRSCQRSRHTSRACLHQS